MTISFVKKIKYDFYIFCRIHLENISFLGNNLEKKFFDIKFQLNIYFPSFFFEILKFSILVSKISFFIFLKSIISKEWNHILSKFLTIFHLWKLCSGNFHTLVFLQLSFFICFMKIIISWFHKKIHFSFCDMTIHK